MFRSPVKTNNHNGKYLYETSERNNKANFIKFSLNSETKIKSKNTLTSAAH